MTERTWLITGVSSGFGRHLTKQLLERGDRVVGTVRRPESVDELTSRHPDLFRAEVLDVRDTSALRAAVTRIVADFGRIDVAVSNAGYGLFGAAEELTDEQIDDMIATNLTGPSSSSVPCSRTCGCRRRPDRPALDVRRTGRVPRQLDVPRHQVGNRRLRRIGGAGGGAVRHRHDARRTRWRAHRLPLPRRQIAEPIPDYDATPAHNFRKMLDPAAGLAPGDPARMAARIIESVDVEPAPLRLMLGSQHSSPPSRYSAHASPTSSPRANSPPPPTSHRKPTEWPEVEFIHTKCTTEESRDTY